MSESGDLDLVIPSKEEYLTCVLPMDEEKKINLVLSASPSDSNSTEDCNDKYAEPGHQASH
jgi:hypothetical protein